MNLCSKKHDEICFEVNDCPLCSEIESAKEAVAALEKEIEQLENEAPE